MKNEELDRKLDQLKLRYDDQFALATEIGNQRSRDIRNLRDAVAKVHNQQQNQAQQAAKAA